MLNRVDWMNTADEQRTSLIHAINDICDGNRYSLDTAVVRIAELPFYKEVVLVEIHDASRESLKDQSWFLFHGELIVHLDGTSKPVHDMNEVADITLTSENVADYVYFFCFFVHGADGPFFVIENADFPAIDKKKADFLVLKKIKDACKSLELSTITDEGVFILSGTVLYGNALFGVQFAVTFNGLIEMIDDEPLVGDIPARKIKPGY